MSPAELTQYAQAAGAAIATIVASIGGAIAASARWRKSILDEQREATAECEKKTTAIAEQLAHCEARHDDAERRAAEDRLKHERELGDMRVQVAQLRAEVRRRISPAHPMPAVRIEEKKA